MTTRSARSAGNPLGRPVRGRRLSLVLALTALCAPLPAMAGFDGTGAALPAPGVDVRDPLLSWRATRPAGGTLALGLTFEGAVAPLVRHESAPEGTSTVDVLTDLGGVRLGMRTALTDRVELGLDLPVWFSAAYEDGSRGAGLGDLQLAVPVGVVPPGEGDGLRGAFAVVPAVRLPTGDASNYLGDRGPGVEARAVGEVLAGPLVGVGWVGVGWRSFEEELNVRPGPGVLGGASLGVAVHEDVAVHLGWRADARLRAGEVLVPTEGAPGRVMGSELALSAHARLFDDWSARVGAATRTWQGPGAADLRLWLGAGRSFGGERTLTAVQPVALRVTDPLGRPVQGAEVTLDGELVAHTDAGGRADVLRRRWRERDLLVVDAPGLQPGQASPIPGSQDLTLAWDPVRVDVLVQDATGNPLQASITVDELERPPVVGAEASLDLDPGESWTVRAVATGFGAQARTVRHEPGLATSETLHFILQPAAGDVSLDVRTVDVAGAPVPGASLSLNGEPVGSSGSGGALWIGGLASEPVTLDAQADTFRDYSRPEVLPRDPAPVVELVLERQRGAVQVVVRDGAGAPVRDASVRIAGADRLGPFPVGDGGRRTFVLRPGSWQLLVVSPDHGVQQRAISVPDRDTALQVVEVVLQPPEDGDADLTIRVVDPDNQPISGAHVALDGRDYGTTSTGGALRLEDMSGGMRTLAIHGEYLVAREEPVVLTRGLVEHTVVVDWKPGATLVMARHPGGMVPDAVARFGGPDRHTPEVLGEDGVLFTTLSTGLWQVLVTSPSAGAQQQGVAIPERSRTLHVVDVFLHAGEDGDGRLDVEVVDPEGEPVRGAEVLLDGLPLGATASSGTLTVLDLSTGPRVLGVGSPPYVPMQRSVDVGPDDQVERVELEWGVGALRVEVTADGEPVTDARVRLGGSHYVDVTPVGPDGRRVFGVAPGEWLVLVTSPTHGLLQRTVRVPEEPGLTRVPVRLESSLSDGTVVRVVDPDGVPVTDASVRVDGGPAQVVGQWGLVVVDATEGQHQLRVAAPHFQERVLDDVDLGGTDARVIELAWTPVPVSVSVTGPDGAPLPGATVVFDGPAATSPVRTGVAGTVDTTLRPGAWTVLASTDSLGARGADFELAPGGERARVDLQLAEAQVRVEVGQVLLQDTIYFDTGKSTLREASTPILDEVAAALRAHPEIVRVEVGGHTDPIGGVPFNMELSRRRARAVVDALVQRGVAPERLVPRGYGPTRPRHDNGTADGRAANRRVEFVVEGARP